MNHKSKNLSKLLYMISAVVLLAGLGSAALIYFTSAAEESVPDYDLDARMYRHNLELYGGKFNLLTDQFMSWFTGLWHGRSLAVIVAAVTVIVSVGLILTARRSGPRN